MAAYTLLVLTNHVPGSDEDVFNKWYTEQHLDDVIAVPGFTSAQRFRMLGKPVSGHEPWKYCATYFLETDDPQGAVDEMLRRVGTSDMPMSDTLDPGYYVVLYEAITPLVEGR